MGVVSKPFAKPASKKKFFGGYCQLALGCRMISRNSVRSLEYRRIRMGINIPNDKGFRFESDILAAHANTASHAHGTNEFGGLVRF